MIYKALTILEPWASLIACGAKKVETRSWPTKYRGPIAIHAGKKDPHGIMVSLPRGIAKAMYDCLYEKLGIQSGALNRMPVGAVIAIADLVDCVMVEKQYCDRLVGNKNCVMIPFRAELVDGHVIVGDELKFGDYTPDRYAWVLANVRRIEPIPAKGMQRIWNWEVDENELHFRG